VTDAIDNNLAALNFESGGRAILGNIFRAERGSPDCIN